MPETSPEVQLKSSSKEVPIMEDTQELSAPDRRPKRPLENIDVEISAAPQPILQTTNSAVTKVGNVERNGVSGSEGDYERSIGLGEPSAKKLKLGELGTENRRPAHARDKVKGVALIKDEYLIPITGVRQDVSNGAENDDAAEGRHQTDDRDNNGGGRNKPKKAKGQNKQRKFGDSMDATKLCNSRANSAEFSPKECSFGEKCKLCHDLRQYLKDGRREDVTTFGGKCPVWEAQGTCHAGWKCRFVSSHMEEVETEDGRKELRLLDDIIRAGGTELKSDEGRAGLYNVVTSQQKTDLSRKRTRTERADKYTAWLEDHQKNLDEIRQNLYHVKKEDSSAGKGDSVVKKENSEVKKAVSEEDSLSTIREKLDENRAQYIESPFRPSEKRRIYFGRETPVLAPLTTQGNLPFRRLCVELGAQLTYSEMAMTLPLIQGGKSEWSLMKAHESEISPPHFAPASRSSVVQGYDNSRDLKFGAQISSSQAWQAFKATEVLTKLVPHLRVIDLNCGCPIELVCRSGAGSALLDSPSKLEKLIRGMNIVSGEVPISAKIRMGTKDSKPTAERLVERLAFGGLESEGPPGCAAVTLHGRSKQQRYTRSANWEYIAECATLIKSYSNKKDSLTDTANHPDARQLPNGEKMYFIGNGDCYSHVDYYNHIDQAGVDSVMIARGALIKPWLFEEIEKGQYIDKSASERLEYIEKYVRYGLETWGSDEQGLGLTRRFLLEWLSFAHRYVPIGILDHLPPSLQDRPPAYRGRNDLETLLSSNNYKDWIKISEIFLGPAHENFQFQPKHKSNSYDVEAEG